MLSVTRLTCRLTIYQTYLQGDLVCHVEPDCINDNYIFRPWPMDILDGFAKTPAIVSAATTVINTVSSSIPSANNHFLILLSRPGRIKPILRRGCKLNSAAGRDGPGRIILWSGGTELWSSTATWYLKWCQLTINSVNWCMFYLTFSVNFNIWN